MKIRVFISSTFSDLERVREFVELTCEDLGYESCYYPEKSVAGGHSSDYIKHLHSSHILVYLATRSSDAVERELDVAENCGIPIIELAELQRNGTSFDITSPAKHRRATSPRFQKTFGTLSELRSVLRDSLSNIVFKRFESGRKLSSFGSEAYELATRATESVTFRLGIVQETPTLLLGARKDRYLVEDPFYKSIIKLISDISQNKRELEFLYIYDLKKTKKEIENNASSYPNLAQATNWLLQNKQLLTSAENIVVRGMEGRLTASVVHDASLEISTVLHDSRYYLWLDEVGGASNNFWTVLKQLSSHGVLVDEYIAQNNLPSVS